MPKKLDKIKGFGKGYMTYVTVAVVLIFGILEGFDIFEMPNKWNVYLTVAGLGFLRRAINSIEKIIEDLRRKETK